MLQQPLGKISQSFEVGPWNSSILVRCVGCSAPLRCSLTRPPSFGSTYDPFHSERPLPPLPLKIWAGARDRLKRLKGGRRLWKWRRDAWASSKALAARQPVLRLTTQSNATFSTWN